MVRKRKSLCSNPFSWIWKTLVAVTAVTACSLVEVGTQSGETLVARTMELAGVDGGGNAILEVLPQGHSFETLCTANVSDVTRSFNDSTHAYAVLRNPLGLLPSIPLLPLDGLNDAGLSASALTLRQTQYPGLDATKNNLCWMDMVPYFLAFHDSIESVLEALPDISIFALPVPNPGAFFHWALRDKTGRSIVLEYLEGNLKVYENQVGTLTNDPDYMWHVRHLNEFQSVSSGTQDASNLAVNTSIGQVPTSGNHGYNLESLPGGASPSSRFARLFFLRQISQKLVGPPKNWQDGLVRASGILNDVWIVRGSVAKRGVLDLQPEATEYSTIKIPELQQIFYRTYSNQQWKQVNLSSLFKELKERKTLPLNDDSTGIADRTKLLMNNNVFYF